MGYRSQVRALIYGPEEQMDVFMTTESLILGSSVFVHFKENLTRYTIKVSFWIAGGEQPESHIYHVLDLSGDAWKWYSSYPDVQAWHDFMHRAEEAELAWEFARIGEGEGNELDTEYSSSMNVDDALLFIGQPSINENFDAGPTLPITKLHPPLSTEETPPCKPSQVSTI